MRLTCLLIGQDTLLIQCGKFLLEHNHQIKWVVTPVQSIQSWCDEHHIPWVTTLSELPVDKEQSVDYLFSIVNGTILTKEDLKIARRASINYHDSVLPKYAGVHATTWSILNGEQSHGITWHLINEGIDEGDIVYQGTFPLAENETALTLNLRCFEEAVKGFTDIIHRIESSSLTTQKQQQENRSYYGLNHVLPDMGFINWNTSDAQSIIRFYRALNFGNYPNNVGLLKIYLNETALIIADVALSTRPCSTQQGGFVLAIEQEGLVLSTTSQPIVLKKLMTLDGALVTATDLTEIYGIHVNSQLPQIGASFLEKNTPAYKKALTHEKYWLKQLANITEHGFFSDRMYDQNTNHKKLPSIRFNKNAINTAYKPEVYLLASVMVYLYRINNYESFTVFWRHPQGSNAASQNANIFANLLPISANEFQSDLKVHQILELINQKLELQNKHDTYLNDIFVRQPSLASIAQDAKEYVITIGNDLAEQSLIHFDINQNTNEINIYHRINTHYQGGTLTPVIEHMPEHINNVLQIMLTQPDALIHQFSFLGEEEQTKLFTWSVGEYRPLPSNTITDLFEQRVKYSPEKVVLFDGEAQLSYHQLWLEAESITAYLQSLHLEPGSLISIALLSGARMLAMILGILKAGSICVSSMDGSSKIYDGKELLAKAAAQHNLATNLANFSVPKQECIRFSAEHSSFETLNQKQIINYSYWFANTLHFDDQSVINIHSSIPCDLMITSVLSSLIVGGTLDFSANTLKEHYLRHLMKHKISHVRISAKEWESLLDYPEAISQLSDLQYVVLTDAVSHTDQILKWNALNPECRFVVID